MPEEKPQPRHLTSSVSQPSLTASHEQEQAVSTRPGRRAQEASFSASPAASVALYASPSYSSLYVEPEDLEPAPGTYDLPGTFGHQHLSTKHSYPSSSLTAKHDKSWAKTMITKDHLNVLMARGTPGPGTYEPSAVPTQARVRFGTSKRKGLSDTSYKAPGPQYEVTGEPDNPKIHTKFTKANRFSRDNESLTKALGSTGPGQYETGTIFDGSRLAKSFGASHRAYDRVRFPGSERMEIGRASPGPGAAQPFQNTGKTSSFGRAERLPGNHSKSSPGPGAYDNHERPSPFSRSQSCYSFGRPHPKGRVNWKQMSYLQNSTFGIN
mmetsp:Transcript_22656/g.51777  ORF Transcript_22656/g.51777 Transcript_22656/m.51777 type:complete len:324 (-) Transcript_22656:76-1047(-)